MCHMYMCKGPRYHGPILVHLCKVSGSKSITCLHHTYVLQCWAIKVEASITSKIMGVCICLGGVIVKSCFSL